MCVTDLPDDLCFSAFHRKKGPKIDYIRKTDDEYEGNAIFRLLRGLTLPLGQVKKRILLETPFVYHAKALKVKRMVSCFSYSRARVSSLYLSVRLFVGQN